MSEARPVTAAEDGKKTSKIVEDGTEATVRLEQESAQCYWNDEAFNKGDKVSVDGAIYECSFGCWVKMDD
ncbi:MAG: hypothetical protein U5P41_11300 [Gammaproteobacteria bacterium]|nr:hypothetical protein [Gammaproteobacteria bacterium]